MQSVISNKIFVLNATDELKIWCEENLQIINPLYQQMKKLGKDDMIARRHIPEKMKLYVARGNDLLLPFGVLKSIWCFIKDSPYELNFNNLDKVIDPNLKISMPLYDYQEEAVQKMLKEKGGVLQASAGSGKTQIGIELIKRIGLNALWLCGKTDLLNQTVDRIHKLYPSIEVGTITDGEVKMAKNGITVSTVQTLVNVEKSVYAHEFGTVVTDECHSAISTPTKMLMFGKVIEAIPARYKFGLTATPSRSDTMINSMYAMLGCNENGLFEPTHIIGKDKTNTLTAKHIKVDLYTKFDYDTLNEDGSFNYMALIDFLSHDTKRNECIVENVIKTLKTHKKQLVLCQRVEHCKIINDMLKAKGVNSVLLVGEVSKKQRKEILNSIKDWNVIVGSVSLVKEGLDLPELSCLHWAMVIGDKVATIQSAGRIERVAENKPEPEIYDYVDVNYSYCIGKYKKRVSYLKKR